MPTNGRIPFGGMASQEATPLVGRPPMTSLIGYISEGDEDDDPYDDDDLEEEIARLEPSQRIEARMAERLSVRLLAVPDDDEDAHDRILRKSLRLFAETAAVEEEAEEEEEEQQQQVVAVESGRFGAMRQPSLTRVSSSTRRFSSKNLLESLEQETIVVDRKPELLLSEEDAARKQFWTMVCMAIAALSTAIFAMWIGVEFIGPPNQPIGPYQLVERQEGEEFFEYYSFYEGRDSVGSNGFNMYVGRERANQLGIVNVTMETDEFDVYDVKRRRSLLQLTNKMEPFVYMMSSPTAAGPRDSIRLEGIRRFNRGLFIIDIRHMPAGCGVWPAFWLTDEANWPVNGEIDIVEGVSYQSQAKTALHTTNGCSMYDIPLGTMTGTWDTAQGIPDAKTGIPDMTLRYARDCFVYNPHQWLNQGCVAVDNSNETLGIPLNNKGGGVFALEWDPINRYIRTWVFTPHTSVPDNLVEAIRTAGDPDQVAPDPSLWPIPYGYFAIGVGTDCPASHFRHMRLVFNLAFCGSVAGNRYFMDCPQQFKKHKTCNEWVASDPDELNDAYWKIRGVFVYERQWERAWLN